MKILMLGWEYPPFHSGGLGVASKHIAQSLAQEGLKIYFALPSFVYNSIIENAAEESFDLVSHLDDSIEIKKIPTTIYSPYINENSYQNFLHKHQTPGSTKEIYGCNLFAEIERYKAEMIAYTHNKDFNLIHAHDWITFSTANEIKNHKNIPYIAHVHATEYDRTGGNIENEIFNIEKKGLQNAEKIIAVSNYTKNILNKHYQINHEKIEVVHNGAEQLNHNHKQSEKIIDNRKKVLFLGRLVIQKGPDWFLKIAHKVLEKRQDVDFLIGGHGEMLPEMIKKTLNSKLKNHVHFLGFLNNLEREKAFLNTDAYVLSSVSEPFGLSAIEAAQRQIPVVLTKQSGAKEVLYHSLSADFWDVDKMADNILAIIEYPALAKTMSSKAVHELLNLTWRNQAKKIKTIYHQMVTK